MSGDEWTIGELGDQVVAALSVDYAGPSNGQVRAVPDRRSIRYYTSLGLMDRPLAMRGRTALYGPRHLNQLVAIKRLQAGGLSLAQIQTKLTGASDRELAALARIPRVPASPKKRRSAREGFWRALPEADAEAETESEAYAAEPQPRSRARAAPSTQPAVVIQTLRFQLAPGVSLLVDGDHGGVTAEDAEAVNAAAQQLLAELDKRGLVPAK